MELEVYDAFYRAEDAHWWFRARRRIVESVLEETLPRGLRIADVGCGTGGMARMLSRFGTLTGVDEAPRAREYCARRGLDRVLTPGAWRELGEVYDLITAFDVVEHVDDDAGFLSDLRERLTPEGKLLVTVPAYPFLWSAFDEMNHHRRRYTRSTLRRALERAGFRVERLSHFNTWLLPPVIAGRMLEKRKSAPTDPAGKQAALERYFRVGPLNRPLESIFASERHWLRRHDLPWGSSILALGAPQ